MIRRPPTEVPLRQEDIADFIARLEAKKSATSSGSSSGSGSVNRPVKDTNQASKGQEQPQQPANAPGVNMVELNREARAGMTRESRLGL